MDNLIFCLNVTIPIFLLMILGAAFFHLHIFNDEVVRFMNRFVFRISLPVLVFYELARADFVSSWDGGFVLFCFLATLLSIFLAIACSFLFREKSLRGEFIQSAYRSSAALLGISFIESIYGNAGMAPLMIIGTVPLYNVVAVIVLEFTKPGGGQINSKMWKETLMDILKNPIIIGIALGLGWSLLQLPMPAIFAKTLTHVSNLTTPLGLMAMGATFNFKKAKESATPAFVAVFMKLILFCGLILPAAIVFGYTQDKLAALLVMTGSPTTISTFVMAKGMGHDGTLSSSVVMLSTLLSAFTLTLWLYLLKCWGLV